MTRLAPATHPPLITVNSPGLLTAICPIASREQSLRSATFVNERTSSRNQPLLEYNRSSPPTLPSPFPLYTMYSPNPPANEEASRECADIDTARTHLPFSAARSRLAIHGDDNALL